MCCNPPERGMKGRGMMFGHHGMSQCCCGSGPQRRFITTAEQLEELQEYRDEIKKELAGIEEAIAKLKGK